ncbi:Hypothetical protein PHPALM_12099 [Phytophthora palmivora]|uniref:Uncharacterized protein n=1 Tax=Phytophthora palmivora TaxID=4796 RepID=A0A2P4Y0M1_9STRA|nr:Hypothetical protein PHPALM_12099 [Phytophthora palmivora]
MHLAASTSSLHRLSPSSSPDHYENPTSIRRSMSKSQGSLTDDTLVAYPGDEADGADHVHGNVDAKEALSRKNLTLAKRKRRAQVTNTANHTNEASARKRSTSQSLHISDQDLDEAYDEEPLEVANNFDEQQAELLAARLARKRVHRERTHTER